MPVVSGYFRASYDHYGPSIAFTVSGWTGAYYPKNGVVFSDAKGGGFFFYTDVNGVHRNGSIDPPFKPKDGEVYGFKLAWDNVAGQATVYINGTARGTLPAPTLPEAELPLQIFQPGYYSNWWDVPEYVQATIIGAGVGAPIGGVSAYLLKEPLGPMVSEAIGAVLGGVVGGGIGLLTGLGIIPVPQIPSLGAAPEGPGTPAQLGKYQITG